MEEYNDMRLNNGRIVDFAKWFIKENKEIINQVLKIQELKSSSSAFKYFYYKLKNEDYNNDTLKYVIGQNIDKNGLKWTIVNLYNTIFHSNLSVNINVIEIAQKETRHDLNSFFE